MSTNNNWIKMTEIKPRLADLPIWVWEKERTGPTVFTNILPGSGWSHWKPADIPAPPREKTQAQKDEGAWADWYLPRQDAPTSNEGWHAALAYERAEVLRLIGNERELRKRCGGEL